jgi:hypothetical protein
MLHKHSTANLGEYRKANQPLLVIDLDSYAVLG